MTKEQLANLIKENPNAEILFMCGEESRSEEYGYTGHYLGDVFVGIEKLALYKERYYEEWEELLCKIIDDFTDSVGLDSKYFDQLVQDEMDKCPFKKYIVIKIG